MRFIVINKDTVFSITIPASNNEKFISSSTCVNNESIYLFTTESPGVGDDEKMNVCLV